MYAAIARTALGIEGTCELVVACVVVVVCRCAVFASPFERTRKAAKPSEMPTASPPKAAPRSLAKEELGQRNAWKSISICSVPTPLGRRWRAAWRLGTAPAGGVQVAELAKPPHKILQVLHHSARPGGDLRLRRPAGPTGRAGPGHSAGPSLQALSEFVHFWGPYR